VVLAWLLAGGSVHQAADQGGVDRHTVRRWWGWLRDRSETFSFWLRSRFPELGRSADCAGFWRACWESMPLSQVMVWLDLAEVTVP